MSDPQSALGASVDESGAPPTPAIGRAVSRRRATLWNGSFRFIEFSLMLVRNFVLVKFFVDFIGGHEYAAWLASGQMLGQLTALDLGLLGALQQQAAVAYGAGNRERLAVLVGTGLSAVLILCLLLVAVGGGLALLMPVFLELEPGVGERLTAAFFVASIGVVGQLAVFATGGVLNALQRPVVAGISRCASEAASLTVTLGLVLNGWGLHAIALGFVTRFAIDAVIVALAFRRVWIGELGLGLRFSRRELASLFTLSGLQFLTQVAGRLRIGLDPLLIGSLLGVEASGAYVLTTRAHETVRMLVLQGAGAALPSMAHLFGEGLLDRFKQLGAAWFRVNAVVGAVGIAGVVALNEQFVTLWVGREWFAGHAVSILYALWALLSLIGAAAYDQRSSRGESGRIGRVVWVGAVLRLALIVPGRPLLGAWTVPAGSCVSQFLAMNWWLTAALWRRLQPAPRQRQAVISGVVRHALVAAVVAAPLLLFPPQIPGWPAFASCAAGVALAAAALSALIDPELRRLVRTRGL